MTLGTRGCPGGVSSRHGCPACAQPPCRQTSVLSTTPMCFSLERPGQSHSWSSLWQPGQQFGLRNSTHGSHLSSKLALPTCSCIHPPVALAVPWSVSGLVPGGSIPEATGKPGSVPQVPPLTQLAVCKAEPGSPVSDALTTRGDELICLLADGITSGWGASEAL